MRTFARRHAVAVATAAVSAALVVSLAAFYTIRVGAERDHGRREAGKASETARFLTGLLEVSASTRSSGGPRRSGGATRSTGWRR